MKKPTIILSILIITLIALSIIAITDIQTSYASIGNNSTSDHIKNHICGNLWFAESKLYDVQCK